MLTHHKAEVTRQDKYTDNRKKRVRSNEVSGVLQSLLAAVAEDTDFATVPTVFFLLLTWFGICLSCLVLQ